MLQIKRENLNALQFNKHKTLRKKILKKPSEKKRLVGNGKLVWMRTEKGN